MSNYEAKDSRVRQQQLKVQEVVVKATDTQIYDANGGNGKIDIGENVSEVLLVIQHDDSAAVGANLLSFAAATVAISGSEITITGLALAANDNVTIKYIVSE